MSPSIIFPSLILNLITNYATWNGVAMHYSLALTAGETVSRDSRTAVSSCKMAGGREMVRGKGRIHNPKSRQNET